jgi:hypothetical protein
VPSAEAKMADFRPSSYRCHVYELWSEGCRFIGHISVLRRAAVTDDKSCLFQSRAGKTGRLTGNPMDRVDAYQPTFPDPGGCEAR